MLIPVKVAETGQIHHIMYHHIIEVSPSRENADRTSIRMIHSTVLEVVGPCDAVADWINNYGSVDPDDEVDEPVPPWV